jgi:hypothetical protein
LFYCLPESSQTSININITTAAATMPSKKPNICDLLTLLEVLFTLEQDRLLKGRGMVGIAELEFAERLSIRFYAVTRIQDSFINVLGSRAGRIRAQPELELICWYNSSITGVFVMFQRLLNRASSA